MMLCCHEIPRRESLRSGNSLEGFLEGMAPRWTLKNSWDLARNGMALMTRGMWYKELDTIGWPVWGTVAWLAFRNVLEDGIWKVGKELLVNRSSWRFWNVGGRTLTRCFKKTSWAVACRRGWRAWNLECRRLCLLDSSSCVRNQSFWLVVFSKDFVHINCWMYWHKVVCNTSLFSF